MGTVILMDLIRQLKRDGRRIDEASIAGGGDGQVTPSEYLALADLFDMAHRAGMTEQMTLQPYGDGFLFRAYAASDPYYTLFEIQKTRDGKIFEYHGRIRHRLVSSGCNFFPFMGVMRAEIAHLIDLFGLPYH